MPKLDGTGPSGQGSGSGHGMGNCRKSGSRQNHCCGLGRGRRFCSSKNELASLQEHEQFLQDELVAIQKEIKAVEAKK